MEGYNSFADRFSIELSGVCNLKCKSCAYQFRDSKYNILMNKETIGKALDAAERVERICNDNGEHLVVCLAHFGEPTYNPELVYAMEELDKRNLHFDLATNGANITVGFVSELMKNRMLEKLTFSNYGSCSDEFESFTKTNMFKRSTSNIQRALKIFAKSTFLKKQFTIRVMGNPMAIPESNRDKFLLDWKTFTIPINSMRILEHGILKREASVLFTELDNYAGKVREIRIPDEEMICEWIQWPVIYANGDVGWCCQISNHDNVIGNINDEDFLKIWNSEKANEYRSLFNNGKQTLVPGCKSCWRRNNPNAEE